MKDLKKQKEEMEQNNMIDKYKAGNYYFELYHFKLKNPFSYVCEVPNKDMVPYKQHASINHTAM